MQVTKVVGFTPRPSETTSGGSLSASAVLGLLGLNALARSVGWWGCGAVGGGAGGIRIGAGR